MLVSRRLVGPPVTLPGRVVPSQKSACKPVPSPLPYQHSSLCQARQAGARARSWVLQASTLLAPATALQLVDAKNILQLEVTACITEEDLEAHCRILGHADDILGLVCLRKKDGSGPPNALIQYRTEADAQQAKRILQGSELHGKKLDIKYGNKASFIFTGLIPSAKLYVRNLPAHLDTKALKEMFGKLGRVVDVELIGHGDSCGQPAAIIRMDTADAAADIVDKWSFKFGRKGDPTVRFAHPVGIVRQRLKMAKFLSLNSDWQDYD